MKLKWQIILVLLTLLWGGRVMAASEQYIGDLYANDTTAFINCIQIPVYVYNNYPYVIAEDLTGYGFDIKWEQAENTLYLFYNRYKTYNPYERVTFNMNQVQCGSVYSSDVKVRLNDEEIASYSLSGRMLISLDELWRVGQVNWYDESKTIGVTTNRFMEKNSDWRVLLKTIYLAQKTYEYTFFAANLYKNFYDNYSPTSYMDYYKTIKVPTRYYNDLSNARSKLSDCLSYVENDQVLYERGNLYHYIYNGMLVTDDIKGIYNQLNNKQWIYVDWSKVPQEFVSANTFKELTDTLSNATIEYLDFDIFTPTTSYQV